MKLYRFSPIKNQAQLEKAIRYTHEACYKPCYQALGEYLPVAGNVGIFCHYDDEYALLTALREKLTALTGNFHRKYFRLHAPLIVPADADVPAATYGYLYIRQPDPYRAQVGDVDFVMAPEQYTELKQSLLAGKAIKGARAFERGDPDMIELFDPDVDALGYLTTSTMEEKVRAGTD